jgi:hypothetical protein
MTVIVLADISGITGLVVGVVGAVLGVIGAFFARRADSELKAARQDLRDTRAELKSANTGIVEMQASMDRFVEHVAALMSERGGATVAPDLETGVDAPADGPPPRFGQALKFLGKSRRAPSEPGTSTVAVGAVDVTNDGRQSLLVQSRDDAKHTASLSILGIRRHQPSELAAILSNNSGANFVARDIDADNHVEIVTAETSPDAGATLEAKAWRWNGARFEVVGPPTEAAFNALRAELFAQQPAWADGS